MHKEFTEIMSAVLDREATPGETARLHEHLAGCAVCAQTWNHWQLLDGRLVLARQVAPAPGFMLRVSQRLVEQEQRARRRRTVGSGLLLAWGATIGLLWLAFIATFAWCYTHPSTLGQVASSGLYWFDGAAWLLRMVQSTLVDLGGLWLSLGVGFYLGLTTLVLLAWAALLLTKSDWLHTLIRPGDPDTVYQS